jgi:protein-disulfide isomerase
MTTKISRLNRAASRACVAAALGVSLLSWTNPAAAAPFGENETKEIQGIVKNYLIAHPEVIKEAIEQLHRREEEKAVHARTAELGKLFSSPSPYSAGQGDVTVVEFFDYNCGYCRRAFGEVVKLIESDKNVRVVFVEFPILSEDSRMASKAAIAAAKQGKYFDFHKALLGGPGHVNEEKIWRAASSVGLNVDQLKKDMNAPETDAVIEANLQRGVSMSVQGTPAFFVGDQAIPGAPENLSQTLAKYVKDVRRNGCAVCGSREKKS